ncbi:MAG: Rieske 2Fe-2S domain-containing protein [Thainema sp.]
MESTILEYDGLQHNLKKIDEVKRPVSGSLYLVPCLLDNWQFWPVIPHIHTDDFNDLTREIGSHIHYDTRFLSWEQVCSLLDDRQDMSNEEAHQWYWSQAMALVHAASKQIRLQYRPVRCVWSDFPERRAAYTAEELKRLYANARMCDRKCPHHQFDLSNIRPNRKGLIECPLHGLTFDQQTGKVVP